MEFRTAYGPKVKVELTEWDPSMTKQSERQEADINFIVQRYQKTGVLRHRDTYDGDYGEFAAIDYHEAMNAVTAAQQMFESLPSSIRTRFHNDPGEFVNFVEAPENREELVKMRLARPTAEPPTPPLEAPLAPEPGAE